MDLVNQYIENTKRIKEIHRQKEAAAIKKQAEAGEVSSRYRHLIYNLETERDNQVHEIEKKHCAWVAEKVSQTVALDETIDKVEEILMFLAVKPKEITWTGEEVKNRVGLHIEELGWVFHDEWLQVKAFVLQNKKPVNKYSVCIFGKSLFVGRNDRETFLKYPHSYGNPGYYDRMEIVYTMKDFPTIEGAKAYFEKNKPLNLGLFIQEYHAVKEEYKKITSTYTLADFKPLFIRDCKACGFFLTEESSRQYSLGDTCSECDINIKEANKIAAIPNKDLPMYMGHEWGSDAAKEFYERRCNEVFRKE